MSPESPRLSCVSFLFHWSEADVSTRRFVLEHRYSAACLADPSSALLLFWVPF